MEVSPTDDQMRLAREIVDEARRNDGLARLDVDRFWSEQEAAYADPFSDACTQLPLGIRMNTECGFVELDEPEDRYRLAHDDSYRISLSRRYNDKSERIIGRRILPESMIPDERKWPEVKKLNEICSILNRICGLTNSSLIDIWKEAATFSKTFINKILLYKSISEPATVLIAGF